MAKTRSGKIGRDWIPVNLLRVGMVIRLSDRLCIVIELSEVVAKVQAATGEVTTFKRSEYVSFALGDLNSFLAYEQYIAPDLGDKF